MLITKLCNVNIMKPVPFLLGPVFLKPLIFATNHGGLRLPPPPPPPLSTSPPQPVLKFKVVQKTVEFCWTNSF